MKVILHASLFALPSFLLFTSALPFVPRNDGSLSTLVKKAKYSVVPVDGGAPAATGEDGSPAPKTVVQTVIQTAQQPTKTITDIPPQATQTLILTITPTIDNVPVTKTIDRTETVISPSPTTTSITTTRYSVVNVLPPTVTVENPEPQSTSTSTSTLQVSSTTSDSTTSSSVSAPSASASSSIGTTALETPQSAIPTSSTSRLYLSSEITPMPTTFVVSSTTASTLYTSSFSTDLTTTSLMATPTTKTYDNGQWHTTYPAWRNGTNNWTGPARRATAMPIPLR